MSAGGSKGPSVSRCDFMCDAGSKRENVTFSEDIRGCCHEES